MTGERSILFINLKPPYDLKASTLRMASPDRTSSVQQILVGSTELIRQDLSFLEHNPSSTRSGDDKNDEDENEDGPDDDDELECATRVPCTRESFVKAFEESHTVILPDSLFVENSRVFRHTENFIKHGLEALRAFYEERGGTVLIQCVEGALSSSCTGRVNATFGTDWKIHVLADAVALGPTPTATRLLQSRYLPEEIVIRDSAFFLSCPPDEGLYRVLLPTREEFDRSFEEQNEVFERLGIEKDDSMACFDVDKSWEDYLKKYTDRYGLAVHAASSGGGRGHVIWYGDRSQTNRTMSFLFCKLLNVGTLGTTPVRDVAEGVRGDGVFATGGRMMILMASFAVVMALMAKYLGF